jgi:hypothetical protein
MFKLGFDATGFVLVFGFYCFEFIIVEVKAWAPD